MDLFQRKVLIPIFGRNQAGKYIGYFIDILANYDTIWLK